MLSSIIHVKNSVISDSVVTASHLTTVVAAIMAYLSPPMEVLASPVISPTSPTVCPALKTTSVACAHQDIFFNLAEHAFNATSPTVSSVD